MTKIYKITITKSTKIAVTTKIVDPTYIDELNQWDLESSEREDICYSLEENIKANVDRYFDGKIKNASMRLENAEDLITHLKMYRNTLKQVRKEFASKY